MLSTKRLEKAMSKLDRSKKDLIAPHINRLWRDYEIATSYHKSLYLHGHISKRDYDKVSLPRLRSICKEITYIAKVIGS